MSKADELCMEKCVPETGGCDNPDACPIYKTVTSLENRIEKLRELLSGIHNTSKEVRSQRAFPVELLEKIDKAAEIITA